MRIAPLLCMPALALAACADSTGTPAAARADAEGPSLYLSGNCYPYPSQHICVNPDNGATPTRAAYSSGFSEVYYVKNQMPLPQWFAFTCGNTVEIVCGTVTPSGAVIQPGAWQMVTLGYGTGQPGTGYLYLIAQGGGYNDTGYYVVPVQ